MSCFKDKTEKQKRLAARYYAFRRDNLEDLPSGYGEYRQHAIEAFEFRFDKFEAMDPPFQRMDFSHDVHILDYDPVLNAFLQDPNYIIRKTEYGSLLHLPATLGSDERILTIKTWDFKFPIEKFYARNPIRFYNEITFLCSKEVKSNPLFMNVVGVIFDKKLAVVYDFQIKHLLCDMISSDEFGWEHRMRVACDIAGVLKWFHDQQIILGKLNSKAIAIDEEYNIKIFDLGLHCHVTALDADVEIDGLVDDDGSYAPEIASRFNYSGKSDVYTFGVVLVELIVNRTFFSWAKEELWVSKSSYAMKITNGQELDGHLSLQDSLKDYFPNEADKLASLVLSCLQEDPAKRPTMNDVCTQLHRLVNFKKSRL